MSDEVKTVYGKIVAAMDKLEQHLVSTLGAHFHITSGIDIATAEIIGHVDDELNPPQTAVATTSTEAAPPQAGQADPSSGAV